MRARPSVPPRPTVGHAQWSRGVAGPLRRAQWSAAAPPAAPPRREVCARPAPLFVHFSGGGGGERVRRDERTGTASCAPSRMSRGPLLERARRKEALRGGSARRWVPLCSVSLRAGRAMPPRARARSAPLFWRRRAHCAPCARSARRLPKTMRPCGRYSYGLSRETAWCHGVITGLEGRGSRSARCWTTGRGSERPGNAYLPD